jgi:transcriptional regulator with XRE-family HTH domain
MTIPERIIQIRTSKGLSQTAFARVLKVAPSLISKLECGKTPLTEQNIAHICLAFGINEIWLSAGDGEMCATRPSSQGPDGRELAPDEWKLLEIYDKLIPENQREVLSYATEKLELQEWRKKADGVNAPEITQKVLQETEKPEILPGPEPESDLTGKNRA